MKSLALHLVALIFAATVAEARLWTNRQGRTVEADVVKVNANRTVVLQVASGRKIKAPFDTFVEPDVRYLEGILAQRKRGKLHSVPWEAINEAFGIEILQDDLLWDDPTCDVGERLAMDRESRTDFMENYRSYPLGEEHLLGEPVFTTALYGGTECIESFSAFFYNKGDPVKIGEKYRLPDSREIEACGERLEERLETLLGDPERATLGRDTLREKVWRWDWNEHAIMLSFQEEKYVALRIMPLEQADNGGRRKKLNDDALRVRVADCVVRRDNGDVVISNIPMIDQGPKGYCSPATWERYFRYLDIAADMYMLALAADTMDGGGTYSPFMVKATRNIVAGNGRKLEEIYETPSFENIPEYIDKGLPVMWRLLSTPDFRKAIHDNTARRNGSAPEEEEFGNGRGGHICLIIGYNRKTGELAISDSYGAEFEERWVSIARVQSVSRTPMSVIKW